MTKNACLTAVWACMFVFVVIIDNYHPSTYKTRITNLVPRCRAAENVGSGYAVSRRIVRPDTAERTLDIRFEIRRRHVIRLDRCPNRPARAPVAGVPQGATGRRLARGQETRDETGIEFVHPVLHDSCNSACSAFASAPQLAKLRIRQFLLHRPVLYSYTVCNCWSCLRCSLQGVLQPPR